MPNLLQVITISTGFWAASLFEKQKSVRFCLMLIRFV